MNLKVVSVAKLHIFSGINATIELQKHFEDIDLEDVAVAYLVTPAGGKYLYVAPTAARLSSGSERIEVKSVS